MASTIFLDAYTRVQSMEYMKRMPFGELPNGCEKVKPMRRSPSHRRGVRAAASQPNFHRQERISCEMTGLRHHKSKLDLYDQHLTSFPSFTRADESPLHIIEDYFPANPSVASQPLDLTKGSWMVVLQKKLRWRWRLSGLVHV